MLLEAQELYQASFNAIPVDPLLKINRMIFPSEKNALNIFCSINILHNKDRTNYDSYLYYENFDNYLGPFKNFPKNELLMK